MGFIYTITNQINGKQYVGKTNLPDPQERWKRHLHDYKAKNKEKRPLYSAMNKYGVENFVFEVIEECDNTEEREKFWIKELNTYGSTGYNATLGGDGKAYLQYSDEEIIEYHCGEGKYFLIRTAQHFKVDTNTIRNVLKKHNVFWVTKNLVKKYLAFENQTLVCQLDPETEEVINIYKSPTEAQKCLGHWNSRCIKDAAHHYRGKETAYGFKWKFLKDMPDNYKWKENK